MSNIYCKCVAGTAKGATGDTFDSLGNVTLRTDAKYVYGVWVVASPTTSTAAEAVSGQLRVTCTDLNISGVFLAPPQMGGAPAVNIGHRSSKARFIPLNKIAKGGEVITLEYATNLPDPTAGCDLIAGVVYAAGKDSALPQGDVMATWPRAASVGAGGGVGSKAGVTTTAETNIDDVAIPGWAKEIVALSQEMIPNLMTAGEGICGYIRLKSDIPDWDPQEWPFGIAFGAPLGTPVGSGASGEDIAEMATSFKLDGKQHTVSGYSLLAKAITTGNPVIFGIVWR